MFASVGKGLTCNLDDSRYWYGFGVGLPAGMLYLYFGFFCIRPCHASQKYFYELKLNQYSEVARNNILEILIEFNQYQINPFAQMNLETQVKDFLPIAQKLLEEKSVLLNQLRSNESSTEIKCLIMKENIN